MNTKCFEVEVVHVCICMCVYVFESNTQYAIHVIMHIKIHVQNSGLTQARFRESNDCNWTEKLYVLDHWAEVKRQFSLLWQSEKEARAKLISSYPCNQNT